ncbi:MAG TPA: hypothetical protein VE172_19905 [Stackebrandtia sp.]|jgi:hypothetical protein|uniref:hypothetical protein n=1 Tax=Stackebrandtia sp. TaxID=2023065 RepID=UPI002D254367|nr:hypothetical protein [Stackebrandtia sp.]HZE41070.1 hypothetical protein [Stackebrandtia sp.]
MSDSTVVIMLGLFTASMRQVSAITIDGSYTVHLDVIGHRGIASHLGSIKDIDSCRPVLKVSLPHGIWASEPAVRWHLIRQAQNLWRTHRQLSRALPHV